LVEIGGSDILALLGDLESNERSRAGGRRVVRDKGQRHRRGEVCVCPSYVAFMDEDVGEVKAEFGGGKIMRELMGGPMH